MEETTLSRILEEVRTLARSDQAKLRGALDALLAEPEPGGADATAVLAAFRHDFRNEYRVVEVTPALIETAMAMAEAYPVRGYDAVQLAATVEVRTACLAMGTTLTLISADVALNAAAAAEGVAVEGPHLSPRERPPSSGPKEGRPPAP